MYQETIQTPSIDIATTDYDVEFPARMPMLLNDVTGMLRPEASPSDLEQAVKILIGTTFKPDVLYADASKFQPEMRKIVERRLALADPERTLLLLPGTGALSVRRENLADSPIFDQFSTYALPTQRIVDNGRVTGVIVSIPDQLMDILRTGRFTRALVIEDVIATGKTLNTVREKINSASSFPLSFDATAWFCRKPTEIDGYQNIQGVFRYWTREGYPALNSLSTWLRTDWKGFIVRNLYKDKYIRYPYGFDKQIREIRALMRGDVYEND